MALVHTHVWVVGSLSETPWGVLEGRKDFSHPRDTCRTPKATLPSAASSSFPKANLERQSTFIILLLGLKFPSLGYVSSPKEWQREIIGMWVILLLIQGTKQILPSLCYWGNLSAPHIPFSLPPGGVWGTWRCQFPRRTPQLLPSPEFPLVFQDQTALQGRGRGGISPAGAPGGTGTLGEVWPVPSSSSER